MIVILAFGFSVGVLILLLCRTITIYEVEVGGRVAHFLSEKRARRWAEKMRKNLIAIYEGMGTDRALLEQLKKQIRADTEAEEKEI